MKYEQNTSNTYINIQSNMARVHDSHFHKWLTNADVTIADMELVGVRWRKDVGVARDLFWVASFLVVAGLAYLIPHWRHLQLALGLLTIPNFAVLM